MDQNLSARVPLIDENPSDERLAKTFAYVQDEIGRLPNLYRVLGHNPELLDGWLAFAWPLRHAAHTARSTRELIIMRTAQLTTADYEWRQHWPMALESGVDEAQLNALATWNDSTLFSAEEAAALRMTDELTATAQLSDESWDVLRSRFDDGACVELILTAAFYSCVSRVLGGLRVPLEERALHTPPVDGSASAPHLFL